MISLTITLPDKQLSQLERAAKQLGVSIEDLVRVNIDELLTKSDEEFQKS
jgi:hypothetical protein